MILVILTKFNFMNSIFTACLLFNLVIFNYFDFLEHFLELKFSKVDFAFFIQFYLWITPFFNHLEYSSLNYHYFLSL